jgi:hypothetical protein
VPRSEPPGEPVIVSCIRLQLTRFPVAFISVNSRIGEKSHLAMRHSCPLFDTQGCALHFSYLLAGFRSTRTSYLPCFMQTSLITLSRSFVKENGKVKKKIMGKGGGRSGKTLAASWRRTKIMVAESACLGGVRSALSQRRLEMLFIGCENELLTRGFCLLCNPCLQSRTSLTDIACVCPCRWPSTAMSDKFLEGGKSNLDLVRIKKHLP